MTKDEMTKLLVQEVKALSTYLTHPTDYENACDDASRETGWAFPVSTDFKILWMKKRAVRALFFYLLTESAYKFKIKQINLQHRFQHLKDAIKLLDDEYEKVQEDRAADFAGVSAYKAFGTKVDAGFAYELQTGRDMTYDSEQEVYFDPNENS